MAGENKFNNEKTDKIIMELGSFLNNIPSIQSCEVNSHEFNKLNQLKQLFKQLNVKIKTHIKSREISCSIDAWFFVLELKNKDLKEMTQILDNNDIISIESDTYGRVHMEIVLPNYFIIKFKED